MTPQKPLDLNYATPGMTPPKRFARGLFGWFLFIGLAIMFIMLMRQSHTANPSTTLTQLYSDIEVGNVTTVHLSDDDLTYVSTGKASAGVGAGTYSVNLPAGMGRDWNFLQFLMQTHNNSAAMVLYDGQNNLVVNLLVPLIPWVLIFFFIWFFVFRQLRKNGAQPKQPMPVVIVNPEAMQ